MISSISAYVRAAAAFSITNEMFATSRAKLRRLHMDFKDFQLIQTDLEMDHLEADASWRNAGRETAPVNDQGSSLLST